MGALRLRVTIALLCHACTSGASGVTAGGGPGPAAGAVGACGGAMAASPAAPGFTVAHIAAPLIRRRLPGQAPFPYARARASMELLELALERAHAEGADAVALTGSIISAPPPLRQCDKGGYYRHPDADAAMEEAQADYLQVKTLLEESGLPYAVTPGAEDCMEAFERVFGLEPSARVVHARAESGPGGGTGGARGHRQTPLAADESEESSDEPLNLADAPDAVSKQAINDFKARLKAAKPPPPPLLRRWRPLLFNPPTRLRSPLWRDGSKAAGAIWRTSGALAVEEEERPRHAVAPVVRRRGLRALWAVAALVGLRGMVRWEPTTKFRGSTLGSPRASTSGGVFRLRSRSRSRVVPPPRSLLHVSSLTCCLSLAPSPPLPPSRPRPVVTSV